MIFRMTIATGFISDKKIPSQFYPTRKRPTASPAMLASWSIKKKSAKDHEKDRVEKFTLYIQSNHILPIPELVVAVEPKTLSFIILELRTRRLAGLKETFEELLTFAGIPCRQFCQCIFTTWGVLLSSEELVAIIFQQNTSGFNQNIKEKDRLKWPYATSHCNEMETSLLSTWAHMAAWKKLCQ